MKTPLQEALAQALFWMSLLGLPGSVAFFIVGFRAKSIMMTVGTFFLGGLLLTHFVWYINFFGYSLAHKTGEYHPPLWYAFIPYGFGVAIIINLIHFALRFEKKAVV